MKTFFNVSFLLLISVVLYAERFSTLEEKTEFYRSRYGVECLNEKITDNFGENFSELYGTRNMKTILYGIAYRGGANNYYHNINKRDNQNPLPDDGLRNLNREGFSYAVYLYGKNWNTTQKQYVYKNDTLKYIQNSVMSKKTQMEIMAMIYDRIQEPSLGPIYLHCWNGWHQSGYVAAITLMQFCDYTAKEARQYWEKNTDGDYKKFENIKKMIAEFKPFNEYRILKETQAIICPCKEKNNKK